MEVLPPRRRIPRAPRFHAQRRGGTISLNASEPAITAAVAVEGPRNATRPCVATSHCLEAPVAPHLLIAYLVVITDFHISYKLLITNINFKRSNCTDHCPLLITAQTKSAASVGFDLFLIVTHLHKTTFVPTDKHLHLKNDICQNCTNYHPLIIAQIDHLRQL